MAEAQQKHLRSDEASHDEFEVSNSISKRQKPYSNILALSLLDDDEVDEPSHDLSVILTTLQQEISFSADVFDFDSDSSPFAAEEDRKTDGAADEDEGLRSVMRHLLEASDDELGISNPEELRSDCGGIRSDEGFDFAEDGIWELEDVAANYYTMLQSELEFVGVGIRRNIN